MGTTDKYTLNLTCDELLTLQREVMYNISSYKRVMAENERFRTRYYEGELKRLEEIEAKIRTEIFR